MSENADIQSQESSEPKNNTTPIQNQSQKGKLKNKKKMLLIAPVLLISVILSGLYIVRKTDTPTENIDSNPPSKEKM